MNDFDITPIDNSISGIDSLELITDNELLSSNNSMQSILGGNI